MQRLVKALDFAIGPYQYAFIPGRLIDDNIRTVQAIIDTYSGDDSEGVYLLFLDQEKAYDRVSRRYLWKVLRKMGVPGKLVDCLAALYEGATVRLYVNGEPSAPILVGSGVRQGETTGLSYSGWGQLLGMGRRGRSLLSE